jgi:hypothetical protein
MSEPTISVFFDDPEGYARWLEAHPDGWLLNAGTSYGPMVHHATCDYIHPASPRSEKNLTANPKHCARDADALVAWAARMGIVWRVPCQRAQCPTHPAVQQRIVEWEASLERAETLNAMDEEG